MRKKLYVFLYLLALQFSMVPSTNATVQLEKAEAAIPVTTLSPPEGNTTFLDGTTWCVARPGVSQVDLQIALDWACGIGQADCGPIQAGGPCFDPDTLVSHASYAFNSYYQTNGNSDIACYFGGTAALTRSNPSYERCVFASSWSAKSSAFSLSKDNAKMKWWKIQVVLLLLYMGRR